MIWQRALNMDQYAVAQQIREKLAEVILNLKKEEKRDWILQFLPCMPPSSWKMHVTCSQVDKEILKQADAKGSVSSKEEAQDKGITILRLRLENNFAILFVFWSIIMCR